MEWNHGDAMRWAPELPDRWTSLGATDSDGLTFTTTSMRIDVALDPDDVFAALAGTATLTGGVLDEHGVMFELPDGGRVWFSRAALGLSGETQ